MQIDNIKKNIKTLLLAVVMLGGLTIATAQGIWTDPTASPVNGNPEAPITQEIESQEKKGGLTSSGIINATGALISYSNLDVGYSFGGSSNRPPTYFFGDTFFQMVTTGFGTPAENKICVDSDGKVKLCDNTVNTGSVVFQALQDKYYTTTNTVSFPTSGIVGGVKYQIGSGLTCTTVSTSGTSWPNGQTLSGSSNNYQVTFYDWGTYNLSMNCSNGGGLSSTYTVTIKVGGRILVDQAIQYSYKLNLNQDRDAEIYAVSAGGSGVSSSKMTIGTSSNTGCGTKYGGGDTYAKLTSGKTIVYLYGGDGAQGGRWRNSTGTAGGACPGIPGHKGTVSVNNMTSATDHEGYYGASNDTTNSVGTTGSGCSGLPDGNGSYDTCRKSGTTAKTYGNGGVGVKYSDPKTTFNCALKPDCHGWTAGGGGGAYAFGHYTLPANGTLLLYAGKTGGNQGDYPPGKNGIIIVTW